MALFSAAGLASALGVGASSFFAVAGSAVLNFAVGTGLNKLALKLSGKNAQRPSFSIKGQLQRGADLPQAFIVGWTSDSGSLTYANTWGVEGGTPNSYLTMVIELSDIPIQSLDGIWVNGEKCTIGETAHEDFGDPVEEYNKDGRDHLWVKFYDGTQTAADDYLVNKVSSPERPWDSQAVGYGIAHVILTARVNRELMPGFPEVMFEITGAPLYDPSRDTSVGGDGPQRWDDPSTWGGDGDLLTAVKLYNLLRGIRYGSDWFYGMQAVTAEQLPIGHWISQIEKCRSAIAAQGGLEPKFRSGGAIPVGAPIVDAVEALLDACQGRISETGGIYKLFVGEPDAAVVSITDQDIVSTEEQSFSPFFGLADTVNGINGKYPDPEQAWQVETAPPLNNPDYEAADGARRLMVDVSFDLVPYPEQVQRLMLAALNEARRARRHTFTLLPKFWTLEAGDVISWTSARNGYVNKLFRVDGALDLPSGDVVVDLTEVDPADYDFDTNVDFKSVGGGSVIRPQVPPQVLSGWAVQASTISDASGMARLPAVKVLWDGQVDDVVAVQVRLRLKASGDIVASGRFDDVAAAEGLITQGVLPASEYQAQGRFVPEGHRSVAWSDWLDVTTPDVRVAVADLDPSVFFEVGNIAYRSVEEFKSRVVGPQLLSAEQLAEQSALAALDEYREDRRGSDALVAVTQDLNARIDAEGLLRAEAVTQLGAETGETIATLTASLDVLSGQGNAHAGSLASLFATTGDQAVTINEHSNAIAGLGGSIQFSIDVNGHLSGFGLSSVIAAGGQASSEFVFLGDKFQISDGNAGAQTPFVVYTSTTNVGGVDVPAGVYMADAFMRSGYIQSFHLGFGIIDDVHIQDAIIDTAKIKDGAVTNEFAAYTSSATAISTSWQTIQSLNIDCAGNPVSVLANIALDGASSIEFDIRVDGVSQEVFPASAGMYIIPQAVPITLFGSGTGHVSASQFVPAVPTTVSLSSSVSISVTSTGSVTLLANPDFYETMVTLAMKIYPSTGSRAVTLHARRVGGLYASPQVRKIHLETTENKR